MKKKVYSITILLSLIVSFSTIKAEEVKKESGNNNQQVQTEENAESIRRAMLAEMIKMTLKEEYESNCAISITSNKEGCCILKGLINLPDDILVKAVQEKDRKLMSSLEKNCK